MRTALRVLSVGLAVSSCGRPAPPPSSNATSGDASAPLAAVDARAGWDNPLADRAPGADSVADSSIPPGSDAEHDGPFAGPSIDVDCRPHFPELGRFESRCQYLGGLDVIMSCPHVFEAGSV